ncbi:MAG: hypothetical protein AAFX07_11485 [Pseudomonadota bacterium]
MMPPPVRIRSELPSGDPSLLNRIAWARRWTDRTASIQNAHAARRTAVSGTGRRSRAEQGMAARTLGWQAYWKGDLDGAMSNCLSAETFLPETEFLETRASIYAILGLVHFSRNRADLAGCALDRGFWLLRETLDTAAPEALTDLLLARATLQRHSGERARSGITIGRATELAVAEQTSYVSYCTAAWLLSDGDIEEAQKHADEGLKLAETQGNLIMLPYLHGLLGTCESSMARVDTAGLHFSKGLSIAEAEEDKRATIYLLRESAVMEKECGNTAEATGLLMQAATLAKTTGFDFERKRVALRLAELYEEAGDYKRSVEQHNLAWRLQSETRLR